MMIENVIVVAPTTAVPIKNRLGVAFLDVLPAPSFSSSMCLARLEVSSSDKL